VSPLSPFGKSLQRNWYPFQLDTCVGEHVEDGAKVLQMMVEPFQVARELRGQEADGAKVLQENVGTPEEFTDADNCWVALQFAEGAGVSQTNLFERSRRQSVVPEFWLPKVAISAKPAALANSTIWFWL
jgi:hypothetical protein